MIVVLAFYDRQRLADLETLLRRTDRQFVDRMQSITDTLLPPRDRSAPPPLDDVAAPAWDRADVGRRGTGATASPAGRSLRRVLRRFTRLRLEWPQGIAVVWAAGLVALGVGATTTAGAVVCVSFGAAVLGLAFHRPIWRLIRCIVAGAGNLVRHSYCSRADTAWYRGPV